MLVTTLLCLLLAYLAFKLSKVGKRNALYPPGPPTTFLLGNLLQLPKQNFYTAFKQWRLDYGPVFHLNIFHTDMVVLSSAAAVRDILDLKAGLTSERPPNHITSHVISRGGHTLWMSAKKSSLVKSKIYSQILTSASTDSWLPVVEAESVAVLWNIMQKPDCFFNEMLRYAGSITRSHTYGIRVPTWEGTDATGFNLEGFSRASHEIVQMSEPGATPPVDIFPALLKLPRFMQRWRGHAEQLGEAMREYSDILWTDLDKRMKNGQTNGAWLEKAYQQYKKGNIDLEEHLFRYQGSILLEAGLDTTASALQTILLASVLHPEAVANAQAEIDAVTNGTERLPSLSDIDQLPFCKAFVLEAMRWMPTAPSAVPHRNSEEIIYKSMIIPKDSTIIADVWNILHDVELFDRPDEFIPERYIQHRNGLKAGVDIPFRNNYSFGAGKRVCSGERMASNQLHELFFKMLWAFDFGQKNGPPPVEYTAGFIKAPKPFEASISLRSLAHAVALKAAYDAQADYFEHFNP